MFHFSNCCINEIVVQHLDNSFFSVNVTTADNEYIWTTDKLSSYQLQMYGISVSKDGKRIFAQQSLDYGGLYCLDITNGNILWKSKRKNYFYNIFVGDNVICCGISYDKLCLIDINSGLDITIIKVPNSNRFEILDSRYIFNHSFSNRYVVYEGNTLEVVEEIKSKDYTKENYELRKRLFSDKYDDIY